jgi:hypothetical protein
VVRRPVFTPKHTIDEVLGWFARTGLAFVRGVPSISGRDHDQKDEALFEPTDPGSVWDHSRAQLNQIVAGNREGGFFIMIGRKPER